MSLADFQHALVDLTLAPGRTRTLFAGDLSVLDTYELTALERERIIDVVHQPGMSVNCTVARANRFEAIGEVFPMTCVLLEPVLRDLLAELWETAHPRDYQFTGEEQLFAEAVRSKMDELKIPYLDEIFAYELVCWDLAQDMRCQTVPDERQAHVEFRHPPDLLLAPLSQLAAPPPGLPEGSYHAVVRLKDGRFDVEMLA